ncbi:MAG TPA: TonB-dependent receptor [Sphingobium sp.]|uniref:TonB-dependent receptor n=1 Tax=Sphingobium sp. TaxID=1912891 RepID=UPI002ED5C88A
MKAAYLLFGSALSVFAALPAMAQDTGATQSNDQVGLEDIIVTAQARNQSLKDVPVSVSVVDATTLQNKNLGKLEDIQFFVPNFKMTEVGITTSIFIRGIGSGENQGFEQSVGLYIDGVHYGRAKETQAPIFDVDRVEVLRGPQSILFGKNSVAGALSITTAKPTNTFKASVMSSYEFNANDFLTEGYVSGPITDHVRARLAVRYRDGQGFEYNLRTKEKNPRRNELAFRGTVEVDVTDNLTATAKAEVSRFDRVGRTGQTFVSDPIAAGPFAGLTYGQVLYNVFGQDASVLDEKKDDNRAATGEFSNNKMQTYSLGLNWALGDYTLKSTSAFTRLKYDDNCDCDFTGADIFSAGFQEKFDQTSQEIRLISPELDSFDFILGGYYEHTKQHYGDQIVVPGNSLLIPAVNAQAPGFGNLIANTQAARTAHVNGDVLSGFAQANWRFTPNLTLQLGGRYTYEWKTGARNMVILGTDGNALPAAQVAAPLVYANLFGVTSENLANLGPQGAFFIGQLGQLPISGSLKKGRFSPDVKLKWEIAHNRMVYASWSRGYKSGGFDFRANNRSVFPTLADSFQFKDEQATNYEIGGKFSFGRNVQINVAAYHTEYKDLQVAIYDGILGYNVGNAAKARVQGIEADGRWAVTSRLTLSGSVAYTDFKFTDYPNGQCYFGQTPTTDLNGDGILDHCSYNGQSNQLVSKFEGSLSADYNYPIADGYFLDATADLSFKSKYNASPLFDPHAVQGAYQLVNLRLAFSPDSERWQIAVLGKNVFDKRPLTYAGALPLASGTFGSDALTGLFLQGRQISVQARLNF